ncbi:MAG: alcohol dehydrogenase-like regulatory protein ErcA [Bacillota bacterium]
MVSPAELRKFVAPEFVFGIGARELVGRYARNLGTRKLLVVTDPGVIRAGWTTQVTQNLASENIPFIVYSDVASNPRADQVMAGASLYRREACNAIVAVGGGSPMDCAKGIGIVAVSGGHIVDYQGVDEVPAPLPPLICVPTTAGSGADLSQFAIVIDPQRATKTAIISKAVVPDVALIDAETTTTMPASLTACVGFDALTHAVEAAVSNAHSPITDLHAMEAIRCIWPNLIKAMKQPLNLDLRTTLMRGSTEAGLAFSNASLGANHAMAHSLGGLRDAPHGECNAILLEHVVEFNYSAAPECYDRVAQAMGLDLRGMIQGARRAALASAIRHLRQALGFTCALGEHNVRRSDIPELARKAMSDPCMVTNPRRPTARDIEVIYEQAL